MPLAEAEIKKIIEQIEDKFPGSVALWIGSGSAEQGLSEKSEIFEALMLNDKDYDEFVKFTWDLNVDVKMRTGYSITVLAVDPETTMEYRKEAYEKGQTTKQFVSCETSTKIAWTQDTENSHMFAYAA